MPDEGQEATVARNRALQVEWYGEPLHDRLRRLLSQLGFSQAELAALLGLSAPMLSQLMSAHRAKIANPAVLARLLEAEQLAYGPEFDRLEPAELHSELDRVRAHTPRSSTALRLTERSVPAPAPMTAAARLVETGAPTTSDPVVAMQTLLRAVASAAEIEAAAALLDTSHPELAEVLRVYGNGRTAQARSHFSTVTADG